MNHAELTSALAKISDHIHIKEVDIKAQKHRLVFDLQYAREQNLNPGRPSADFAKIKLADSYIVLSKLEYDLDVLKEKRKNIKKSLARLTA